MPRENLLSLFREFDRYRSDIAVIQKRGYRRETWTYGRLTDAARSCAILLQQRGVKTGEHVLLWASNSAEWVAAFWGCLLRGAVAVPMDDGANVDFVARVASDAAIKLIFTTRERVLARSGIFDPSVQVVDIHECARASRNPRPGSGPLPTGALVSENFNSFSDVPLTRAHVAEILFTSGTTSEPRGVVLTHGNFLANLEPLEKGITAYSKYERWFHPLRFVTLVPLSHVFGQFMALFLPPLLGAGVAFEMSANPGEIMRSIKREHAVALVAVPRMIESLRTAIEREFETRGRGDWLTRTLKAAQGKKFLHRAWIFRRIHRRFGWKFWAFISGGAALAHRDEEFFKRLGYAVVQGYGMTETASLISLNHPFSAIEGSIGKILPGREFRLAKDGEILVRGENVSAGYWEAGGLRGGETNDWLHTGDIGELDAAGNLHFRGRKKNVIITPAALNIYPEDLEAALRKQGAVRDCVVIPVERNGNLQPFAVLVPGDGQSHDSASAAIANANASLAEYQRILDWMVWQEPDFPRTSTGKPRLAEISARAQQFITGRAPVGAKEKNSSSSSRTNGDVEQLVRRFTRHAAEQTDHAAKLDADLNLTSLDRAELLSALEDKFHVELDETSFSHAKTVADIQTLLKRPAAKRSAYSYPRWAQSWPFRILRLAIYYLLVWPATMLLAHPRVVGRENFASLRGPVLVISNHVTRRSDIGLILSALPRRYRHNLATAMGGETLRQMRQPPCEWFLLKRLSCQLGYWVVTALFNVFPLPQQSGFRESFRFAGESVDRGYSVLVFPEGEVTQDESMTRFRSGIGLLAENLGLQIVPIRLDGVWQMKSEHRRLARRGEITIRIGAPVHFPPGTEPDTIAQTLEALVRSL
ncbi:MAG: AMP-binding protein [Acidobacteriota bacterium]|nr:AMP-binding protein [Acidobacteriota bacterium]